ncbi:MAG: pilus assembly protein [Myxococcales bacterium]|nr:MAG: pilus assembly protein [Myxococcales bacterium]
MEPSTDMHERERGQAAAEFAICLPVIAMLLMAIISYGQMIWADMELTTATRDGARRAAVSRTDPNPAASVKSTVLTSLDTTNPGDVTVTVAGAWQADNKITVTATRPWSLDIMGIEMWNGNLSSVSTVRIG